MTPLRIRALVALLPFTAAVAAAVTRDFQATWTGNSGAPTTASYRIYAPSPADAERVRGVVIFGPGSGGDWRFRVDSAVWQEAARSLDFALIGLGGNAGYFSKTEDETRRMIDAILGKAADVLGRPELVNAPIAVTGFSLGGWTSADLLQKIPERVITAIPQHGGDSFSAHTPAAARKVPLLYIPGSADTNPATNSEISAANFVTYRGPSAPNGLAAFAVDWRTPHEPFYNQAWAMAWTWIAEVAALRCPPGELPSLAPGNPLPLLDLVETDGWLGKRAYVTSTTGADRSPFVPIAPYASYAGDKTTASWLPNEAVARAYRALNSYDGGVRSQIPLQGPLAIVGDAAPCSVIAESDQINLPQLTVWPLGSTITLRLDPREFDDVRQIVSVEFHDGAEHIGTLTTPGPNGWSVTRQLATRGIRSFTVVATDSAGNKSSAFRAVVVAAPHAIPERPLVQFEFNETGPQAVGTGAKPVTATFVNAAGTPADLHGEAGGGVSGRAHDRAFDNRASTGMGSAGTGGGLSVGDISAPDALTSMTLQGWFKTDAPINGAARVFEKNFGAGTSGFVLRADTSSGRLVLQVNSRAVASAASYGATGQWVFFAVTYDALKTANNVEFFVGSASAPVASAGVYTLNGGSVAANTVLPNTIPLVIGNNSGAVGFTNDRPFKGLLDNLRLFGAYSGSRGLLTMQQLELIRRCDLKGEELPVPVLSLGENGNAPSLGFTSAVGRSYQLQRSLSLGAGSWTPAGPVWEGMGGELRLEDRAPVASDRLFYRVLVSP